MDPLYIYISETELVGCGLPRQNGHTDKVQIKSSNMLGLFLIVVAGLVKNSKGTW